MPAFDGSTEGDVPAGGGGSGGSFGGSGGGGSGGGGSGGGGSGGAGGSSPDGPSPDVTVARDTGGAEPARDSAIDPPLARDMAPPDLASPDLAPDVSEQPVDLARGLVAYWKFDEGTGTTVRDTSPSGNNGTFAVNPTDPTWHGGGPPGKTGGNFLTFDGNNDVIDVRNLNSVLGNTGTVAFWIRTNATGNNTARNARAVIGGRGATTADDMLWGFIDGGGLIGLQAGAGAAVKSANAINDNNWHHVAVTRDSTTGRVEVYVNGTLSRAATSDTGAKTAAMTNLGRVSGGGEYYEGDLDEVRVWDRVLTADEVTAARAGM